MPGIGPDGFLIGNGRAGDGSVLGGNHHLHHCIICIKHHRNCLHRGAVTNFVVGLTLFPIFIHAFLKACMY